MKYEYIDGRQSSVPFKALLASLSSSVTEVIRRPLRFLDLGAKDPRQLPAVGVDHLFPFYPLFFTAGLTDSLRKGNQPAAVKAGVVRMGKNE